MKGRSQDNQVREGLSRKEVAEWVQHAEGLESKATCIPEIADRNDTLFQAAEIWERLVDEPIRALHAYERVLEVDPNHKEALSEAERLCAEGGFWDDLTNFYLQLISQTNEPKARVERYHQVARLQEEGQGEHGQAFLTLQVAFREDVTNDRTASELERLARRGGLLSDLIAFYTTRLNTVRDEQAKGVLFRRLGLLYSELGQLGAAASMFNQALEVEPDDVSTLSALVELYLRQEQWEELVAALTRLASIATDTGEKTRALVNLGELYEVHFRAPASAGDSYKAALQLDPLCVDASDGLKRAALSKDDYIALSAALGEQLEAQTDSEKRLTILRDLASIAMDELEDVETAVDALKDVMELDPDDELTLKAVDEILEREERWDDLVVLLDGVVDHVSSDRQRIDILLRLATIRETHLENPTESAETLEALVEIDATHATALKTLVRLYRHLERWEELTRIYGHQLDAEKDPDACLDLSYELGHIAFERLEDPMAAIIAWENARRLDEADVRVLEGLVLAYEAIEEWAGARDALERLLDIADVPRDRVEYHNRLAKILLEHLDDPSAAVDHLRRSLDIDPKHRPSLSLLKDLYLEQDQWQEAAVTLKKVLDLTHDIAERSVIFNELGAIHDVHLRNAQQAEKFFVLAINYNPRNVAAAGNLVELYVDEKRFADANPLFDVLLHDDSVTKLESPHLHRLYFLRGVVLHALDDHEAALASFKDAYDLEPDDLATVRKLAELHRQREEWEQASTWYESILGIHLDALTTEETIEVLHNFGHSQYRRSELREAVNMLNRALELEPNHRPTIDLLLEIHEQRESWHDVVHIKRTHLEPLSEEERVESLLGAADLHIRKLFEPLEAIECIEEAVNIQPSNKALLERLIELYTNQDNWVQVIQAMHQALELEDEDAGLARRHKMIATLYRDKLQEPARAVIHLEKSLELDPTQLESFEAIDSILTAEKAWVELADAYSRMIERIEGNGGAVLLASLWHSLGEIRRTQLGELEKAAHAFETASSLEPENVDRHVILAELYGRIPDEADKAIEKHRLLLANDPLWVTSYMALSELYRQTRQFDKAWCMCAALCFLGKATHEEVRFYSEFKLHAPRQGVGYVTDELWHEVLMAPGENRIAGKIFEIILPALLRFNVRPHEVYGLNRAYRYDPAHGAHPLGDLFNWSAYALGMRAPDLFPRDGQGIALSFVLTEPLASLADMMLLSEFREEETRFEMGRHLSTYRGGHYIRCLLPDEEGLRRLFLSAVQVVRPSTKAPGDPSGTMAELGVMLRDSLPPETKEQLASLVETLFREQESLDIAEWMKAVELTAYRAGLLLCGDITCAPGMLRHHPPEVRGLSLKEAVRQLVIFSISESYFRLREAVGLSMEPPTSGP